MRSLIICILHEVQGGPKVYDQFYNSITNCQGKCETNFIDGYIHKVFFIHSAHFSVCRTENI
jgi:hypothetical protein